MQSCRAGRELPLHAQKAINARRQWKRWEVERHLGQAAVLESKPQQTFPASHSHHPLATTTLSQGLEKPCELGIVASAQRALKIASAGGTPLVSQAQFGTGSRPQDCPVLMAVENLLWPISWCGSWSIQVALLLPFCYSSFCKLQTKHSNRSLSSSVSTCTSQRSAKRWFYLTVVIFINIS